MDIGTGVAAGLTAIVSKDLIPKVLGPTAEYIGQETLGLAKKCNVNLSNILKAAFRILEINKIPQKFPVNTRVFKEIITEGKFAEDELLTEYFGGLLASSKTETGCYDRALYYLCIVKALSIYQLRLHYIVYYRLCKEFQGEKAEFLDRIANRRKLEILVPMSTIEKVFGISGGTQAYPHMMHALTGLSEKMLIGKESGFVDGYDSVRFQTIHGSGILLNPTLLGCETFIWGNGNNKLCGSEIGQLDLNSIPELFDVSEIILNR